MSKEIINIIQNDSGGENPKSGIFEDKLWELHFNDSQLRVLGKFKMLEYLSKGTVPAKTVHEFKKWEIKTVLGHVIRTWVVVYDDKSHIQLANKDFYSLLTNGHKNKDEEKQDKGFGDRGAVSNAVMEAVHKNSEEKSTIVERPKSITTPEEKKQLEMFRQQAIENPFNENQE